MHVASNPFAPLHLTPGVCSSIAKMAPFTVSMHMHGYIVQYLHAASPLSASFAYRMRKEQPPTTKSPRPAVATSIFKTKHNLDSKMPIYNDLKADSPQDLPVPESATTKFFVCFIASIDPATGQPWCSDVRAALPILEAVFGEETQPEVRYIYVGQKTE